MLLYVYRLRSLGARQSRAQMANEGLRGELRIEPYESGWSTRRRLLAYLFRPGTRDDMLPRLEDARLARLRSAITIVGTESVPRGRKSVERHRQTWVCSPTPIDPGAWPERPAQAVYTGFDPAEDDIDY